MELYDDRRITTLDALKRLEEIINEINQAKKEQAKKDFNVNTFTIYWLLKRSSVDRADTLGLNLRYIF
jgi:hypothetical protein